jgi:cytochrome c oxidase subunit 3
MEMENPYGSRAQRDHALHLGMWVFLGSETLLFAGLFGLYTAYRLSYPTAFAEASHHNEEWIGSVNTFVLILSSFFIAWAIALLRAGRRRACLWSMAATLLLGCTFLGLKSYEYASHFAEGIKPGPYYAYAELPERGAVIFFTLYYFITGLHALHVVAGMVIIGWLLTRVYRRRTGPAHLVELELGGLYWHLVDIMWIFIWPLLYLIG